MRESRDAPRELFPDPALFGKGSLPRIGLDDVVADRRMRARWRAAQLQWEVSRAVQERLKVAGTAKSKLADRIGWRRERLSRALTGHARMSLDDMFLLLEASEASWIGVSQALGAVSPGDSLLGLEFVKRYLTGQLAHTTSQIDQRNEATRSSIQRPGRTPTSGSSGRAG